MANFVTLSGLAGNVSDFLSNLLLVAPNKGEAKRSTSGGEVLLSYEPVGNGSARLYQTVGYATDDLIVGRFELPELTTQSAAYAGTVTTQDLKEALEVINDCPNLDYIYRKIPVNDFDVRFWISTVAEMVKGSGRYPDPTDCKGEFALSPERLRKFSLLNPRGQYPLDFMFSRYPNTSLYWKYGPLAKGAIATLNRNKLDPEEMW